MATQLNPFSYSHHVNLIESEIRDYFSYKARLIPTSNLYLQELGKIQTALESSTILERSFHLYKTGKNEVDKGKKEFEGSTQKARGCFNKIFTFKSNIKKEISSRESWSSMLGKWLIYFLLGCVAAVLFFL